VSGSSHRRADVSCVRVLASWAGVQVACSALVLVHSSIGQLAVVMVGWGRTGDAIKAACVQVG
jgi:hypothetical protein